MESKCNSVTEDSITVCLPFRVSLSYNCIFYHDRPSMDASDQFMVLRASLF